MCFLWITVDDKPWQEYTNEFRKHEEKLDNVKTRGDVPKSITSPDHFV